jgi:hypothetical protein
VKVYFDALPVNLVLVSPMFMFLGGGPSVIAAMLYTTIADITSVDARYDRSTRPFLHYMLIFSQSARFLTAFGSVNPFGSSLRTSRRLDPAKKYLGTYLPGVYFLRTSYHDQFSSS